ncbi:O-antigen ligase family protein [Candidatus Azambacteria bacterium]|nr:O-antigen ligase family protein [Candidatus Azambacteria bacterium]
MPSYLLRFDILGIPTTALEVLIYTMFFVFALSLFFDKEKTKAGRLKTAFLQNKTIFFGISLFVLGAFFASAISQDPRVSFGLFKAYFFDPLIFLAVFISVVSKDNIKPVFASFLASGVVLSVISIFGTTTYDGRLQGFFNSPNFLAMSLSPVLLAFFALFLNSERMKYLYLFLFFVVSIPFFLTYSFGAFFGVFVAMFFIIFLSEKPLKFKVFLAMSIFILAASLFLFQAESKKAQDLLSLDARSSFASREMIWRASYEILKDNYVFGIGPGMFQKYYLDYQKKFDEPYLEWAVPHPHNIFLAFWLQNGIIGLFGFLIILFFVFKGSLSLTKNKDFQFKSAEIFLLAFFAYFVVHGIIDTPYWKNDLALTFFLFLGVVLILKSRFSNQKS